MKILYIDTSSSYLYAGIVSSGKLLCEVKKEFGHSLSEEALPSIVGLFNERNLKATDIDKIIVVNGPGSFTGIRIGITIAKVFAWSLNIPITTISALEAMSLSSKTNMLHVPILDARRGYVFSAIYDQDNSAIFSPKHIKLEELLQELQDKENYIFITNDVFESIENKERYDPDIEKIVNTFESKEPMNPHAVNPEYLKLTEAEESKLN
ncbi:MAG: tRNA (adenosine(37)-N6)-threonylcarbamoyltransferase complex dimerization subunit type 1 TsaB [Bacilli bacterium]